MEKELTGNEKIAIFDGWIYVPENNFVRHHFEREDDWLDMDRLELYQKSWDWLMPVVEKIESLGFTVTIEDKSCVIDRPENINLLIGANAASKIEAVYKAVLEFIDWYNKQEK